MVHGPLKLFLGRIQKSLGLWARKAIGLCKQGLKGHSSGSLGEENAKRNTNNGGKIVRFQRGTRTLLRTGQGALHYILAKFHQMKLNPKVLH